MGWGLRDEPGTAFSAWRRGHLGEREPFKERERVRWQDGVISPAQPLLRPAPRSAMFFPLVVIVAVLPGLYALNSWDLTPPGPWWGLRAMAVLDGAVLDQLPAADAIQPALESWVFRTVAAQPPLYAWLEAIGLALSSDHNPLASVLPSYVAGVAVVVLVYLHGRLWRGPGLGLIAAVLTGFNHNLLIQMQQAAPTTLALAGVLGALYCYGRHLRLTSGSAGGDPFGEGGPVVWAVLGGLSLGLSLMTISWFALAALPVVVLHQIYLVAGAPRAERDRPWWPGWAGNPSLRAGAVTLLVALAIAAPWHVWMISRHGFEVVAAWLAPLDVAADHRAGLLERLIALSPAALILGLFGAVRSIRLALTDESDDRAIVGGALWVIWLAVAALLPAFWPRVPGHLCDLFLLVPLNLLAAQVISDLAGRRISVRSLIWLAPATALTIVWWNSVTLRNMVDDLTHGRATPATALGLHMVLDLLIVAIWLTRRLDRWARRRDDRQRRVLAGFFLVVLGVMAVAAAVEVQFRHEETEELIMLRTMILRRNRESPLTLVAVVGPEAFRQTTDGPVPGGRLRFILRTALPHIPQRDLASADELLSMPDGQRLVIIAGNGQRLPNGGPSRLKLEAIHPGREGVLDAFATAYAARPGRSR